MSSRLAINYSGMMRTIAWLEIAQMIEEHA